MQIRSLLQNGFSLLELLVVLLLISVLSTIAIRSTVDIGYSTRYEQTRDRLESIRAAIIGKPKVIINGQPALAGFVADMGRLPNNIHELLEEDFCLTDRTVTDGVACLALPGGVWRNQQNAAVDATTNLKYGWRGPYLTVADSPANADIYTDGWGREAQGYCTDRTLTDKSGCLAVSGLWVEANADHNYGWYFDNTTDMNDLILFSYGKDYAFGGTGYHEDYPAVKPVTADDWLGNVSNGLSISFLKKRKLKGGACGFSGDVAQLYATDGKQCLNVGGGSAPSCLYNATSCAIASGIWNVATANCDFNSSNCTAAGKTWDATTLTCYVTKAQCTSDGGTWSGRIPCAFVPASCVTAGGSWNEAFHACDFNATTCPAAGGIWDMATASCDFTPTTCQDPTHTPPVNGIWGCGGSRKTCHASGGFWRECRLAPTDCSSAGGTNRYGLCDFSRLGCLNANGSWNSVGRTCSFTSTTCPAGSTWNGSGCDFSGNQCDLAGGINKDLCAFDSTGCASAGGSYDSNTGLCSFVPTACAAISGISSAQDCAMTNREGENFGPRYFPSTCEANNGVWSYHSKTICLNVFYRQASDSAVVATSSNPEVIEENGSYQTINFSGFAVTDIPVGNNAVAIYEFDGDCNSDNALYPDDRTQPMPVTMLPRNNLPVINW